jgi:hypothetical protein
MSVDENKALVRRYFEVMREGGFRLYTAALLTASDQFQVLESHRLTRPAS